MLRTLLSLLVLAALGFAEDFDTFAKAQLKSQNVPGAAVGVIQDGKVIFAKGYGVRDHQSKAPVTSKTIFGVGSVSKSFTATVVASVIDEGKLSWDRPVREYLPWFAMDDPVATQLITVRDMLTHRSGLPRHDFIRFSTYLSREELVRRVRFLPLNHTFREVYQYNNLMFVTAGYLAGVLANSTWEELVQQRIYNPIGMTRSNTSSLDSQKSDDFAKPHSDGKEEEFYVYQKYGVGPNGAVNSCVDDMLKYLQMWLDNGKANGTQILSPAQMSELKRPVSVVNATASYAPGWQIGSYRGHRTIAHGGAITGFRAHVMMLPEKRTAIVAMINDQTGLAQQLVEAQADRILGLEQEKPLRGFEPSSGRKPPQPVPGTKLSRELAAYTGTFHHPAYGNIRVDSNGENLQVRFDAVTVSLKHFHYDTFSSSMGPVRFVLGTSGEVREMHLPLEAAVKPFVFLKQ